MVLFLYLSKKENFSLTWMLGFVSVLFLFLLGFLLVYCLFVWINFSASRQVVDMPDNPAACGQMLEAIFSAVTQSVIIFTIQESHASTLVCSSKLDETLASLMISRSVKNMHMFRISGRKWTKGKTGTEVPTPLWWGKKKKKDCVTAGPQSNKIFNNFS